MDEVVMTITAACRNPLRPPFLLRRGSPIKESPAVRAGPTGSFLLGVSVPGLKWAALDLGKGCRKCDIGDRRERIMASCANVLFECASKDDPTALPRWPRSAGCLVSTLRAARPSRQPSHSRRLSLPWPWPSEAEGREPDSQP